MDVIGRPKRCYLQPADVLTRSGEIETIYAETIDRIERLKLSAGLRLRRERIDTKTILLNAALKEVAT
jgi:hypothetical protein